MKALTFFAAATLLCCGCSKTRQTQADVYKAIESDLRLPSEEQARKGRYAEMRVAARLDESYNAISYDLMPIKLQKGRGDFFDSVVFLRTVHFLGPQHQSSVLEEEIYVYAGMFGRKPFILRRRVFDVRAKKITFEEFLSDVRRN